MHRALAFLLPAMLGACDTALHLGEEADASVSAACLEADQHSDFAYLRDKVFPISCSNFTSCHRSAPRPAGDLDLTATRAFRDLLKPAVAVKDEPWARVVPGDPMKSYILVKLGRVNGPLGESNDTMPPNSPPLCKQKIDAIERWIAAGAME